MKTARRLTLVFACLFAGSLIGSLLYRLQGPAPTAPQSPAAVVRLAREHGWSLTTVERDGRLVAVYLTDRPRNLVDLVDLPLVFPGRWQGIVAVEVLDHDRRTGPTDSYGAHGYQSPSGFFFVGDCAMIRRIIDRLTGPAGA